MLIRSGDCQARSKAQNINSYALASGACPVGVRGFKSRSPHQNRVPELLGSKIFNTGWSMKKEGYAETTIKITVKRLKYLARHVNLDEPEKVKGYIASKDCSNTYKEGLVICYD